PTVSFTALFRSYDDFSGPTGYTFDGTSGTATVRRGRTESVELTVSVPSSAGEYIYAFSSGSPPEQFNESLKLRVSPNTGRGSIADNSDFLYVLGYALFEVADRSECANNTVCARAVSGLSSTVDAFTGVHRAVLTKWE
ncbi:MAG: hypothetical protein M3281_06820, partial [Chloroflexota bacterium]|nr:hypothetical protein [Chloroflexota bacterium]